MNLRPFGSDVGRQPTYRLDETAFALVMVATALTFAVVFLGPWGEVKMAAYAVGTPAWLAYAAIFLAVTLILVPGLFALAVRAGQIVSQSAISFRLALAAQAQVLVPLGLGLWVAFTIAFGLVKLPYVLTVFSDPLALGWNLFRTARLTNFPDLSTVSTRLEVCVLGTALFWSARVGRRMSSVSREAKLVLGQAIPVTVFCLLVTLAMLRLLAG